MSVELGQMQWQLDEGLLQHLGNALVNILCSRDLGEAKSQVTGLWPQDSYKTVPVAAVAHLTQSFWSSSKFPIDKVIRCEVLDNLMYTSYLSGTQQATNIFSETTGS